MLKTEIEGCPSLLPLPATVKILIKHRLSSLVDIRDTKNVVISMSKRNSFRL